MSGGGARRPGRSAADPRACLEGAFAAAVAAVHPRRVLADVFAPVGGAAAIDGEALGPGRVQLLAIGKAAAAMAQEAERALGARIARGLCVTKDGHGLPLAHCALREAGHPHPDARSAEAGREALALAAAAGEGDTLLVLLSGGASALVSCPLEGLALDDLRETGSLLQDAGAEIDELNTVRKHLGAVGGGRLAAATAAQRTALLAISDVPGDRLDVIGSGPCTPDPSTWGDALRVVRERGVVERLPPPVRAMLERGARGELDETPKQPREWRTRVRARIVADNAGARAAALEYGRQLGLDALDLGASLRGEARDTGASLVADTRRPGRAGPLLAVAGGETTVQIRGKGRGGRSQELALGAALAHREQSGWTLLAAGTDGGDGPTDAAGAFADGGSCARGALRGVDAEEALARNDSYAFFLAEGGLFRPGPTQTNVMDLALLYLEAS